MRMLVNALSEDTKLYVLFDALFFVYVSPHLSALLLFIFLFSQPY